jgi:hypothetical protein
MRKAISVLVFIIIAFVVVVLGDWYRFIAYAELDPKRGVYGNDHLEVWIPINQMMPRPMRRWGCEKLLRREAEVMGATYVPNGRTAPLGCNEARDSMPSDQAFMQSFLANAENAAEIKNASAEQKALVKACVETGMRAAMKPAQLEALKTGQDMTAITAVAEMAQKVTLDCLAQQGL